MPDADRFFAVPLRSNRRRADIDTWADMMRSLGGELPPPDCDIGLIEDWSALRSDHFDPEAVHPIIRGFYDRTTAFEMEATVEWTSFLIGRAYSAFSGFFMQLAPGGDDKVDFTPMKSTIAWCHKLPGPLGSRLWRRVLGKNPRPFYTAVVRPYIGRAHDGRSVTYLSLMMPYPFGQVSCVFEMQNRPAGGFLLTSRPNERRGDDAGFWVVVQLFGRTLVRRAPLASGERVVLEADATVPDKLVRARHEGFGLGDRRLFHLTYRIRPAPAARPPA